MEIIKLSDIVDHNFAVSEIFSIEMMPKNKIFVCENRPLSGFLYITEGECEYTYANSRFFAKENDLIYIPQGSYHIYKTVSEAMKYIRVNFQLTDIDSKAHFVFANIPFVVLYDVTGKYKLQLTELSNANYAGTGASLMAASLMFNLLYNIYYDTYSTSDKYSGGSRFQTIADFISKNYYREISTVELAELYNMSVSHFRRCFKIENKMSPTEYINRIRVEKACAILRTENVRINEIAEKTGFNNIYYFSRVFKKNIGLSPNDYRKSVQGVE